MDTLRHALRPWCSRPPQTPTGLNLESAPTAPGRRGGRSLRGGGGGPRESLCRGELAHGYPKACPKAAPDAHGAQPRERADRARESRTRQPFTLSRGVRIAPP